MKYALNLPIDEFIPSLLRHIQQGSVVVSAAPGAGKTTRLPPALLSIFAGKVLVLEPRRMAAVAAAHRIAEENNWQVGQEVGYQVRFANKISSHTRLIFMTEALLARQLIEDPELKGVDAIVLDEFHERSLHVDLSLGLIRELQELGRDIKLIVMSATLDAKKISEYLGNVPAVQVPGKLHALEIKYQKNNQLLQTSPAFFENLFATLKEAQKQTSHDILVFLPGLGEIERCHHLIESWAQSLGIQVLALHGSLNLEEQKSVLQKKSQQRIILSTNIAESSLTLDGVNTVIDSGLAKVMRQDLRTGFSRLEMGRISLSSATQRAGRAARQYPGVCYRLWNKSDELSFTANETPEIMRSDLSESLLFLAAQGVRDFTLFLWYEKPSAQALNTAQKILLATQALNHDNNITSVGRNLLHFPLPVRMAKIMLAAIEINELPLAAQIVALMQEKDLFRKDSASHFLGDDLECDLEARLHVLNEALDKKPTRGFNNPHLVLQSYQQILHLAENLQRKNKISLLKEAASWHRSQKLQYLLLSAFSDRLCRRRKNTDRAVMTNGRGIKLSPESLVKKSEFFIALNGMESSSDAETLVSWASCIDKDFVLSQFANLIRKKTEILFNEEKGQFYVQEYRSLYELALEEPSLTVANANLIAEQLPLVLSQNKDLVLKNNLDLHLWFQKIKFLTHHLNFVDVEMQNEVNSSLLGDEAITKLWQEAMAMACLGENNFHHVVKKDLVYFFENCLSEKLKNLLHQELPNKILVPSNSWIQIQYPETQNPYIEVRIQEIFGWTQTPSLLFKKIPMTIHLLGPNYRPVQITQDLESFWKNGYAEVRKELRLKYPKHQWPEDPSLGVAEAKGRRRH